MGRHLKQGLDYFPLGVDFFEDDKIEYITARFDEKGELITIKLLCAVYRNGYFTDWNDDKALIFSKRAGKNISPSLANDVVNELVKRGFFDRNIFNSFGILTSQGIQKRFLKAIKDSRTNIEINADYWLIDTPLNTQKSSFIFSSAKNSISPKKNNISPSIYPQSKVKKSKIDVCPLNPPMDATPLGKRHTDSKAELNTIWLSYGFTGALSNAVKEWISYKKSQGFTYRPQGLKALLTQVKSHVEIHGDDAVIEAISKSIANGYKGIVWPVFAGGKPVKNRFINFAQRDNNDDFVRIEELSKKNLLQEIGDMPSMEEQKRLRLEWKERQAL